MEERRRKKEGKGKGEREGGREGDDVTLSQPVQ